MMSGTQTLRNSYDYWSFELLLSPKCDTIVAVDSVIILSQSPQAKPPNPSFTNLPRVMTVMKQIVITLEDRLKH